ncbi:MAG: 7TM diverse intracellular signaling domain-containing protein, partial [Rhodoferax sp.]|nr:7TM diverse intracellular signaling domain-containing protein [Rhodoferax sp.]
GTLVITATGVLILSVGVFCAVFKRQRIAVFFVAAFSMWIFGIFVVGLKTLTLLPANTLTMNGYQIGSALEMLLLAFALAYRFNMIRRQATKDVKQANASLEQRLRAREAELTESHQRLREIEHSQTLSQERQRLMQDMHDGMGSALTSALRVVERGQLDETEVAQVLKGCIDDLKLAIDSMEPVNADLLLLLATLRFRLGPRLESTGIALRWEVQDIPPLDWLDPKNSLHVLRIAQEAFTNIIKHTNATEVRVATGADADGVTVTITDNGSGFDVESALKNGGKGLSNQMRRAQAIGAEVNWDSNNSGTRLTLRLPFMRQSG